MRLASLAVLCLAFTLGLSARADDSGTPTKDSVPTPGGDSMMSSTPTFTLGNSALDQPSVKVTLYGFIEADSIYDATQSSPNRRATAPSPSRAPRPATTAGSSSAPATRASASRSTARPPAA